ncbi:hypothetical protein [Vibrio hyugaensis]|uniref:hypothetical protein n=1 Tax=Vibrio hyugaensis TaxID=1534743 RepID=UPI0005F078D4|nr:hypothetical protein [Vibrio hyugaensis]
MKNISILKTSVFVAGLASFQAMAHFPLMSCHLEQEKVICEAGYSDGSTAVDYDVEMYDYDDNLIAKVATDKRSIAEFSHPQTDFYLVFDAGHENPVEVDIVELKEK